MEEIRNDTNIKKNENSFFIELILNLTSSIYYLF